MPSTATLILTTSLLATLIIAGYFYFTGQADDVIQWVAEKYFKAEAKAEEKALEKAGETKAEGFLYVSDVFIFFFLLFLFLPLLAGKFWVLEAWS